MTYREYYILLLEELIKTRLKIVDIPVNLLAMKAVSVNSDSDSNKFTREQIQTLETLCQNLQEKIHTGKVNWLDKVISMEELLQNKSI